jgi:copper chaperone CopZ
MNTQTTSTVRFNVKGMTCGGCVRSVQGILTNIEGMVDLDVRVGSVTIVIDPHQVDAEAIGAALKKAGYVAELQNPEAQ